MPKSGFEPITSVCLRPNNTLALTSTDTRKVPGPAEKKLSVLVSGEYLDNYVFIELHG